LGAASGGRTTGEVVQRGRAHGVSAGQVDAHRGAQLADSSCDAAADLLGRAEQMDALAAVGLVAASLARLRPDVAHGASGYGRRSRPQGIYPFSTCRIPAATRSTSTRAC